MIGDADRTLLLKLARESLVAHVRGGSHVGASYLAPSHPAPILLQLGGAFVTLHKGGDLRGCIGHIEPSEPLGRVVPRCAVAAGSSDPRFPAINSSELEAIDIEISLLGPLETIAGPQDIVIGRDGLVVERGWQRGLLLPQVAVEWGWDAEAFLAHTCRKAGLPMDAWQKGATMWKFEAEVFGEKGAGSAG
jgi:AmmeMemoRadiSam system protein A